MRKLKTVHVIIVNGVYGIVASIISVSVWFIFRYNSENPIQYNFTLYQYFLILLMGLLGNFGNQLMIMAFQFDKAGRVASINFMQILFSYLGDIIIFGYEVRILEFLGAAIIIICSTFTMVLKYFNKLD